MTYRRMQHIWTCIIWHHIPIWCFASLHINFSKVIKMIKTLFKSIIGEHYHGTILTIADGSFDLKTQSLLVRKNFSEVQRGMKWNEMSWLWMVQGLREQHGRRQSEFLREYWVHQTSLHNSNPNGSACPSCYQQPLNYILPFFLLFVLHFFPLVLKTHKRNPCTNSGG